MTKKVIPIYRYEFQYRYFRYIGIPNIPNSNTYITHYVYIWVASTKLFIVKYFRLSKNKQPCCVIYCVCMVPVLTISHQKQMRLLQIWMSATCLVQFRRELCQSDRKCFRLVVGCRVGTSGQE